MITLGAALLGEDIEVEGAYVCFQPLSPLLIPAHERDRRDANGRVLVNPGELTAYFVLWGPAAGDHTLSAFPAQLTGTAADSPGERQDHVFHWGAEEPPVKFVRFTFRGLISFEGNGSYEHTFLLDGEPLAALGFPAFWEDEAPGWLQ